MTTSIPMVAASKTINNSNHVDGKIYKQLGKLARQNIELVLKESVASGKIDEKDAASITVSAEAMAAAGKTKNHVKRVKKKIKQLVRKKQYELLIKSYIAEGKIKQEDAADITTRRDFFNAAKPNLDRNARKELAIKIGLLKKSKKSVVVSSSAEGSSGKENNNIIGDDCSIIRWYSKTARHGFLIFNNLILIGVHLGQE